MQNGEQTAIWILSSGGAILGEEVGEFHQAVLHDRFGGKAAGTSREEAVQIAAVALQIIEYYDRIQTS